MKRVIAIVLVAGLGGFAGYWYWPRPAGPVMRLHGTVEVQEVRLGSKAGGRVASVGVKEGQTASAGQELIRFDDAELVARRDQHDVADAPDRVPVRVGQRQADEPGDEGGGGGHRA